MSAAVLNAASPREAACAVLLRLRKEGGYADRLMDRELAGGQLSGPDRGLFAELVFGVLRRQGTLDHILSQLLTRPLAGLAPQVLICLRVGLYQLVYLDRIPESAAVNEAVAMAKKSSHRFGGLVNAVLRNYLRRRELMVFPDPVSAPAEYIAARHSHPLWLVRQWISQLGAAEAERLAEASSLQPSLTLRVNTLRISRDEFLRRIVQSGIQASPGRYSPHAVVVEGGRRAIRDLPGFQEGLFTVQDEASQLAGLLLEPRPGQLVLDACSAPGGKATHLAQQMDDRGELLAMDISKSKLSLVRETAERLGMTIIHTRVADLLNSATLPEGLFDLILLDAPCSGLGVIRRNPEAKWRLTPADISRLAETQKKMLKSAIAMLKPGGRLLYSTCSTSRQENEDVVHDFLSRRDDCVLENLNECFPSWRDLFSPEGMMRAWPHRHSMDGFFAARLYKKADLDT